MAIAAARAAIAEGSQQKPKRGKPVKKRGLFEPRHSVEARCDPVVRLGHRTSDPCVSGFVRPGESYRAQLREKTNENDDGRYAKYETRCPSWGFAGVVQNGFESSIRSRIPPNLSIEPKARLAGWRAGARSRIMARDA